MLLRLILVKYVSDDRGGVREMNVLAKDEVSIFIKEPIKKLIF